MHLPIILRHLKVMCPEQVSRPVAAHFITESSSGKALKIFWRHIKHGRNTVTAQKPEEANMVLWACWYSKCAQTATSTPSISVMNCIISQPYMVTHENPGQQSTA